jgi:hypothetical protein
MPVLSRGVCRLSFSYCASQCLCVFVSRYLLIFAFRASQWQVYHECSAGAHITLHFDLSFVLLNNLLHYSQA